eukprot:CAMPEP_0201119006 /NCGR_PEP_ID=MMETSP0850-20130426/3183_1 /ASSEMBLY_ACC=CAM_ASM_000622 /TAXON_ID=183588 /ORGANISM="Pseudo-nitzschia fraudulenta, Strain WWA7" /LENGTH=295 /DNA_ID=CAMNT_0047384539 /DNA_START=18 /DNA_END=901 /DNA_ORIENTATION=+
MAKCLQAVSGHHVTQACINFNLCAGLRAGIEGAAHVVREAWQGDPAGPPAGAAPAAPRPNQQEGPAGPPARDREPDPDPDDPQGTLLVDAANGFNELGRKALFWTTRHRWPHGARFAFNCYRHSAQLVLRGEPGSRCSILLSREGVTQGDPLSMVLYGLSLVPLAETLRRSHPDVIQPWYADDAAMHGTVSQIASTMRQLLALGPARGYFPEPAKSIFLGRPETSVRAREVLEEFNFKFLDGHRYIGGFIGTDEARDAWLAPQIQQWVDGVKLLSGAARRYPQAAFTALTKSLQT